MSIKVESVILVYAFRYALGRQTGAVIDVIDSILSNLNNIEEKYKTIMISETVKYLEDIKDSKYIPQDIIERWRRFVVELYYSLKYLTSKSWLVNSNGGGLSKEVLNNIIKEN